MIFYVTIKFVFFSAKDKNHLFLQVLKFVSYTTIISGVFGVVEFISANVFDVNLNDYIPRPSDAEKMYNASVVGLFYRARGFANESGVFTQMMELFAPITIYYLFFSNLSRWKFWLKIFYTTLIFFSVVFAASSATFIIVPVSVAIAMCFYSKEVRLMAVMTGTREAVVVQVHQPSAGYQARVQVAEDQQVVEQVRDN